MEISWILSALIVFMSMTIYLVQRLTPPQEKSTSVRLPPGPPRLPIIGNLHHLASKTLANRRLAELAKKYGPIMYLRLGEVPTVVVSSPDWAAQIMKTHDANFANRPYILAADIIYHGCSDIGLAPHGEYWRQVRKIATLELFTMKRALSFRGIREEELEKMVKSIASKTTSGPINLSDIVFNLIFNITSRIVFSRKGEHEEKFKQFLKDLTKVLSGFSLADLYPSVKPLHSIGGMKRKLEKMVKESDIMLNPIIEEHKSKNKQSKTDEDLVDVLLNYHQEGSDVSGFQLTMDNIKAVVLEIFSAGSETSFGVVEWAMSLLLKNPKVMEKAQAEVRQVYKRRGVISETTLDELKFLKLVVKETLRLYPVAPLLIPREAIESAHINGYDIPAKTRILVNVWAILRDSTYWPEPDAFKPERFENCSTDFKGTNFEYLPFGAGRRICPGITLGIVIVELTLAKLLCHFDWKLPDGLKPEDLHMDELLGISLKRKGDLQVEAFPFE